VVCRCAGLVGSKWLLPKLKQLPEARLSSEAVQQKLLAQHSMLVERISGDLTALVTRHACDNSVVRGSVPWVCKHCRARDPCTCQPCN